MLSILLPIYDTLNHIMRSIQVQTLTRIRRMILRSALSRLWTLQTKQGLCEFAASCSHSPLSEAAFDQHAEKTLQRLTEQLEGLENGAVETDMEVSYAMGVLTVKLGDKLGTYVLNKQAPNRQIWFSSPLSGPKRFDYEPSEDTWIYRRENVELCSLLEKEMGQLLKTQNVKLKDG